jgi:hypothetical protein
LLRFGLAMFDEGDMCNPKFFDVTFSIMEMLAQMELILGNFQECIDIAEKTISQAKSTEMILTLIVIGAEERITAFKLNEALGATIHALGILGLKISRNISAVNVVYKFLQIRLLLCNVSDEDILNIQIIEDKTLATTIKILLFLCTYLILKNKNYIAV